MRTKKYPVTKQSNWKKLCKKVANRKIRRSPIALMMGEYVEFTDICEQDKRLLEVEVIEPLLTGVKPVVQKYRFYMW